MRSAHIAAQAKLNLLLRIVGREPGGYHQLVTLFQRIALADDVTVRVDVTGRSLDCAGADAGPAERNLAWRAAVAYADAAPWLAGFAIEVTKRIPVGGGLGGGSADAAAVLRALDALAPHALPPETLAAIAFGLGADVPYLTTTHALALGTGRGERLVALSPLPERRVLLLVPPFGVSSTDAFGWQAADRGHAPYGAAPLLLPALTWAAVEQLAANDLERAVFARHPQLRDMRSALHASGARMARMSGSGSTLFGLFADRGHIEHRTDDARSPALAAGSGPSLADAARSIDIGRWGAELVPTTTVQAAAGVMIDAP